MPWRKLKYFKNNTYIQKEIIKNCYWLQVDRNGKRIKSLLLDDAKPAVAQMAECLADWYKLAQTVYLKSEILEKDVRECERTLNRVREDLYRLKSDLQKDLDAKLVNNSNQTSKIEQKNRLRVRN